MADGPVTVNIGHVQNAFLGNNLGIVHQGSSSLIPGNLAISSHLELNKLLNPIPDASYARNRKTSPPDSDCFPGTRTRVIQKISTWANSSVLLNPAHIFFLHGYVGCGKSSISQAVSQKFGRKGRLPASFFFYRNSGDRSKMIRFAVTLASQMIAAIPATRAFIEAAVKAEPALLTARVSLSTQLEHLVYKPFRAVVNRGLIFRTLLKGPFLIVVDGLDECEDKAEVKEFIEHLLDFFKRHPSTPLRFFITSRVEQHIHECLNTDGVLLDDLIAHGSDDDILTFLEASFLLRGKKDPVIAAYIQNHGQWPTVDDKETLVRQIGGSFIFASALFKYIVEPSDDGLTPMTRLPLTFKMNPSLDGLYSDTLGRSQHLPYFSDVISTLALLFEPLPVTGIAKLLGIETFEVIHILVNLQAIIHIPGSDHLPVTLCHTSLRDFLTTESRSGLFFAPAVYHLRLIYRCFVLRDEQQAGTAAVSYSENYCEEHLDHIARLPTAQGPVPRFPQTLDALYLHVLTQSNHLAHFSDIISTLAYLFKPLPVLGIAQLLGIETCEVFRVLNTMKAIVSIPTTDELPVVLRHVSFRDFLTTETRSEGFFAPPSYHLRLLYRCLALRDKYRPGSAAASGSYCTDFAEEHMKEYIRLHGSINHGMTVPVPPTLDDFYTRILSTSRDLPHFSDIIATLALLFKPLPVVGIAELLGIETVAVADVFINLHAIIHSPRTADFPVTMRHMSLRSFLTAESRSGLFFVPPSYHLKFIYTLTLGSWMSNHNERQSDIGYDQYRWRDHWDRFLDDIPRQNILAELVQLTHLPSEASSYRHLFSFMLLCLWIFGSTGPRPQQLSRALAECIKSLTLALKCDPPPDKWLEKRFVNFGFFGLPYLPCDEVYSLKIHQEDAAAMQRNIDWVETAIRANCPSSLSKTPSKNKTDGSFWATYIWLEDWTVIEAYRLLEWITTRVRLEANLGQGSTNNLELSIADGERWYTRHIKICAGAQQTAA